MISELLLAADLVDAVANPYSSIEEHENGAARLAMLAAHGARVDNISLENATEVDVHMLSGHIWRWALEEAKRASPRDSPPHLPNEQVIEELFAAETDRMSRLLMVESVLTHPEAEAKFTEFAELREPVPLEQLPNIWPRDHLIRSSRESEGETDDRQAEANLTELGMIVLQIATPTAIALLGGTIMSLRDRGRESHPLIEAVRAFVSAEDEDLALRLGIRRRGDSAR